MTQLFGNEMLKTWNTTGIDWIPGQPGPVTLEGHQCLVFFLGGIPVAQANGSYAATGFTRNPQDPAGVLANRSASTFEFKNNRLREWCNLQLRFEAFNIVNRANFGLPGGAFGSAQFGVIQSTGPARILQVAAKLVF